MHLHTHVHPRKSLGLMQQGRVVGPLRGLYSAKTHALATLIEWFLDEKMFLATPLSLLITHLLPLPRDDEAYRPGRCDSQL